MAGSGLTINAGTSTINGPMNTTVNVMFLGGGKTYNNVNFSSSTSSSYSASLNDNSTYNNVTFFGAGKITGSNTFNNLTFSPGFTYILTGGQTQTVNGFTANGTCNSGIVIQSSNTTATTISKSSGTVTLNYVTLSYNAATGGATFNANNSVDGGNNSGWSINGITPVSLYWIGNSGNWNEASHWSLTSGGSAYGCIPRTGDNVFFDGNSFNASGQTVTLNVAASCNDMTWTGVINNPTLTDAGNGLTLYGSLTLASAMTLNLNGTVNFAATTTGQTITTANKTFNGSIIFNGAGGWTLQDSLKDGANADITLTAGTLNTNDQAVSCRTFYSTGSLTRALNMGASVFNLGYYYINNYCWSVAGTGLTINAGTSTVNGPANATVGVVFNGGGKTYYNVSFPASASASYSATVNDNSTFNTVSFMGAGKITGSNTFNNLTFSPGYTYTLTAGQTQTINGALNANGNCTGRIYIQSSSSNAASAISKTSGSITLNYVTLTWMTATGGATFTANNAVDGGNNTGWTINAIAANNLYWIGNTGNWNDVNHWSLTSGGSSYGCYPSGGGAPDNVFFDANSFSLPNQTVTINVPATCNNMDWTGATYTPAFSDAGSGISIYGSLTFVPAVTLNLNGAVTFASKATGQTITTANKTIYGAVTFNGAGGAWTLQDSLKVGPNGDITLTTGTLNTNDKAVSCRTFYSTGALTRTLNMGASVFNLGYYWLNDYSWDVAGSGFTLNAGTSTINAPANAPANIYFYGGGKTYYNVNFPVANAGFSPYLYDNNTFNNVVFLGAGRITGSNTFNNLTFSPGNSYVLTSSQTQTITTGFTASGTCTSHIYISASTAAVSVIGKVFGTVTVDYVTLTSIDATGGATFNANNSIDGGNNTGWNITAPAVHDLYWIGNAGNWTDPDHWSLTSGGTPYGCYPGSAGVQDNVFFDANSFTLPTQTVTINIATATCNNMTWSGALYTPVFSDGGNGISIYGSLTLQSAMTSTLSGPVNFLATTSGHTITTANKTFAGSITFNGNGGGWTLQDSLKAGANADLTLTTGSLNTNDQAVSCRTFYSTGALARTLTMGASVFNLGYYYINNFSWDVAGTNFTLNAGTSTINGPSNVTVNVLFYGAGKTYYNVNFPSSASSLYSATINDNSTFNNVVFSGAGKITGTNTFNNLTFSPGFIYTLTSGQTQTITTALTSNGTCTKPVTIKSSSAAVSVIGKASGAITINYTTLMWIAATGGATFTANNSVDGGNNVGWIINPVPGAPTITANGNTLTSSSSIDNQWYLNGNIINGATNQTYNATVSGIYTVVVTDTSGCVYTSSPFNFIYTGSLELVTTDGGFKAFPNPASVMMTVSFTNRAADYSIRIFDLTGRIVLTKEGKASAGQNDINFDLQDYKRGVYILQLQSDERNEQVKLVLE